MGHSSLLEVECAGLERTVIARKAELGVLSGLLEKSEKSLGEASSRSQDLSDAVIFVQRFSEGLQSGVVQRFESLITPGVREIWGRDYTVRIDIVAKGTISAEFIVVLPNGREVSMKNGEGGGLRDFVAVLQRILYLVLEPSQRAKMVFMDENMKMLDSVRSVTAFDFIIRLLKELDVQAVWITHSEAVKSIEQSAGFKIIDMTRTEK